MYRSAKKQILESITDNLSEKRLKHIYGVAEQAKKLAAHYGADETKAELAALAHDCCKELDVEEMNRRVLALGMDAKYLNNGNLAHGKLAAALLSCDFKIEDPDIRNAVSYHTTGRADMSLLEKLIFVADAIELGRKFPGVDELRRMAYEDLDKACLLLLEYTIETIGNKGSYLDEDTVKARNFLLGKEKQYGE